MTTSTDNSIVDISLTNGRLSDCAERLRNVTERTLLFLQSQFDRLAEAYAALPNGAHDSNADDQADWQAEKAIWERQQAADEARIEEQLDHLANAWKDLEAEQRRLMTLGQAAAPAAEPAVAQSWSGPSPQGSLDLVESTGRGSSASAAIQFQKLKREILQQSRRPR